MSIAGVGYQPCRRECSIGGIDLSRRSEQVLLDAAARPTPEGFDFLGRQCFEMAMGIEQHALSMLKGRQRPLEPGRDLGFGWDCYAPPSRFFRNLAVTLEPAPLAAAASSPISISRRAASARGGRSGCSRRHPSISSPSSGGNRISNRVGFRSMLVYIRLLRSLRKHILTRQSAVRSPRICRGINPMRLPLNGPADMGCPASSDRSSGGEPLDATKADLAICVRRG